ncbi:rhomboid family protein [Frigoriglobus tundricola]|uniref:Peptidase S54 rhomboid domain-containing protein n=1 Tax=Frigoriglobus tundricola TaxID=2774151 RepID=A0A6M5YUA1_9BACT|nr:rhomboid family intramembrane serine protease [Frigoriglobus tundricola]QJW96492.1 hypothetical protein FTUN_4049 [Frigoriglobus tundricola]
MEPGHEVETHAAADATPLPMPVVALGAPAPQPPFTESSTADPQPFVPTAVSLLRAIAAADGPWFPARFAAAVSVPRDSLDEPLTELRVAGFVRVAEWVRGVGQGYAITPEGATAAADPAVLDLLSRPAVEHAGAAVPAPGPGAGSADPEPQETDLALTPPIVVPVLLMANALWFFVCAVWGIRWGLTPARVLTEGHRDVLHRFGAVSGTDLIAGEWWRLLSSCFVHIGLLHLVGNMFVLAMMGPLAELLWGRGRLLLIYLISGLAGSSLAMALRPDSILAGASGAIWGIQMSLFAWLFAFRHHLPADLAADWFRRMFVVFVLNVSLSFLDGVSWEGHLGGGVAGFLVAGLLNAVRFGDPQRRGTAYGLLALIPVLCVVGVAAVMDANGTPGWRRLHLRLESERGASEALARQQKLRAAQVEYNAEIAWRLAELSPERVRPFEWRALVLLGRTQRPGEKVSEFHQRAEALKGVADALVTCATRESSGDEAFDRHRERVRACAVARARAMGLLLGLLETNGPPPEAAMDAWRAARAEADQSFKNLGAR